MTIQVINQTHTKGFDKSSGYIITRYAGLSTDVKPTDCKRGSTLEEEDTGIIYGFNGATWYITSERSTGVTTDKSLYNTTLDLFDLENYKGKVFTFSKTNLSVANDGYFDLRIKAGDKLCYMEIFFSSEGKGAFKTYLNTTYTANGTLRTPFPRNSASTTTLLSKIYEAPTIQTLGALRGDEFTGAAMGSIKAGGKGSVSGTILAPQHDLLIRLQNKAGIAGDLSIIINMLEF